MALFKTASGSLTRRRISADISSKHCKKAIISRTAPKVNAGVIFKCHIARQSTDQGSLESENFEDPFDTNIPLHGSHGSAFKNKRLPWLSQLKRFPISALKSNAVCVCILHFSEILLGYFFFSLELRKSARNITL